MATSFTLYDGFPAALANKEVDWDSDTIKALLATSAYTPDRANHAFKSDLTNEATGTGYAAGGVTVAATTTTVLADSWAATWQAAHAYAVGDVVRPTTGNGHLYVCAVAGTSGGAAPIWPTTARLTVADGGATWAELGTRALVLACANPSWATLTLTARYLVLYDDTPALATAKRLVGWMDFGADKSPDNGPLTVTLPATGLIVLGG